MSVYPSATPSQKRRKPALCQSSSRWLTHHAGATSGGPSPRISYATRRAPRGRNRISDFSSIAMSLRRPPEQRKNIRQRHSQLHPAQCLGYLLWCPDPYRTVNLVDIEPVRRGDLLRPRLSPPIERVTDAAVFDRMPTEPTLDAAGGSGGWIRGVPPTRHIRLPRRHVYTQRHRERHRSVWFASDFAAEIGVRNYPRLAVFSGDLRGAVHARSQWPSPSVEAVRGDQVGDLLAGDRGRDQPGRGRPQVAHRRIDGDRDTAHGQGRRLGRAGTQTGTTWHATRLAVGGGTGGDRAADRGGQGAGDRAVGRAGKIRLRLSGPVPARVPADVKEAVLKSVDDAVAAGLAHTWVCGLWQVSDSRLHRWRVRRRDTGTLVDRAPGGHPVHALLSEEIAAILDVAERWGTVDRSHRKLAHRGSYEHLVWVSPSTFRRVLIEHGLTLPEPAPRTRTEKRPWPDWLVWEPNRIWIWDATHFTRARRVCFAIVDMVSRKWIDTLVSVEETATQVTVIFEHALQIEGLLELLTDERLDLEADDPRRPILLAVSDNGPPMTARDTRAFMSLMAIAQHHGRPHVPQDQAWIESFFGHIKGEWPHLETIAEPSLLEAELLRVRTEYNSVRLHEAIGYVTPDDEHTGRGEAIRQARHDGLERARQRRLDYHRYTIADPTGEMP